MDSRSVSSLFVCFLGVGGLTSLLFSVSPTISHVSVGFRGRSLKTLFYFLLGRGAPLLLFHFDAVDKQVLVQVLLRVRGVDTSAVRSAPAAFPGRGRDNAEGRVTSLCSA